MVPRPKAGHRGKNRPVREMGSPTGRMRYFNFLTDQRLLFLRAVFLVAAFFDADFLAARFFGADFLPVDFLAADFFVAVFFAAFFFAGDFLAADFLRAAFFFGTFAPSSRASDRPIAIACLRLVTFPPLPDFNVPALRSCMARSTFAEAFGPYFAIECCFEMN